MFAGWYRRCYSHHFQVSNFPIAMIFSVRIHCPRRLRWANKQLLNMKPVLSSFQRLARPKLWTSVVDVVQSLNFSNGVDQFMGDTVLRYFRAVYEGYPMSRGNMMIRKMDHWMLGTSNPHQPCRCRPFRFVPTMLSTIRPFHGMVQCGEVFLRHNSRTSGILACHIVSRSFTFLSKMAWRNIAW